MTKHRDLSINWIFFDLVFNFGEKLSKSGNRGFALLFQGKFDELFKFYVSKMHYQNSFVSVLNPHQIQEHLFEEILWIILITAILSSYFWHRGQRSILRWINCTPSGNTRKVHRCHLKICIFLLLCNILESNFAAKFMQIFLQFCFLIEVFFSFDQVFSNELSFKALSLIFLM